MVKAVPQPTADESTRPPGRTIGAAGANAPSTPGAARLFFTWLLPGCWVAISWASFHHPGDEYGLWAVSSLPGLWGAALHHGGDTRSFLPPVLASGFISVLALAFVMDLQRVSRRWFAVAWPVMAGMCFMLAMVATDHPLRRSRTVEEGLIAYGLAAINLGLCFTTCRRAVGPRGRSGVCPGLQISPTTAGTCSGPSSSVTVTA
jgi:hypothetical protein